ncbi:DUF3263 domain-containing protein [Rhodococcus sp. WS4]|nr:DUF3263 domain-containing protein [Rhodococcus sp. WS4]
MRPEVTADLDPTWLLAVRLVSLCRGRSTASNGRDAARLAVTDEVDIRAFRQWCDRRHEADQIRNGRIRLDKEAEEIVQFARRWTPFGRAPAHEIFIEFGMSPTRFAQRLREVLRNGPDRYQRSSARRGGVVRGGKATPDDLSAVAQPNTRRKRRPRLAGRERALGVIWRGDCRTRS